MALIGLRKCLFTLPSLIFICIFLLLHHQEGILRVKFQKEWPICRNINNNNIEPKIVIIVTSNAKNFELRNAQRKAFPSKFLWTEFQAVRYFLVAQDLILEEMDLEQDTDIILGEFEEGYRNLVLKHIMGLSYVVQYCSNHRFVCHYNYQSVLRTGTICRSVTLRLKLRLKYIN